MQRSTAQRQGGSERQQTQLTSTQPLTQDSSNERPDITIITLEKRKDIISYIIAMLFCTAVSAAAFTVRYVYPDILKDANSKQKNIITNAGIAFAVFASIACACLIKSICHRTSNTVEPVSPLTQIRE